MLSQGGHDENEPHKWTQVSLMYLPYVCFLPALPPDPDNIEIRGAGVTGLDQGASIAAMPEVFLTSCEDLRITQI